MLPPVALICEIYPPLNSAGEGDMGNDGGDAGKVPEKRVDQNAAVSDLEPPPEHPPHSGIQKNPLHVHNFNRTAPPADGGPFVVARAERKAAGLAPLGGAATVSADAVKPAPIGALPRDALTVMRLLILANPVDAEPAA